MRPSSNLIQKINSELINDSSKCDVSMMSFHKEGKKSEFQNKTKEYRSIFVGNENGTQFCFFFFFFVFVEVFGTLMNRGEMRFL